LEILPCHAAKLVPVLQRANLGYHLGELSEHDRPAPGRAGLGFGSASSAEAQ